MFKNIKINYRVFIFQLGCTIIALFLGAIIGTSLEFASYKNKVFKNISIGDISIGHESFEDARKRVEAHYIGDTQNTFLVLQLQDYSLKAPIKTFITGSNVNTLVQTAIAYSETLSLKDRYKLLTDRDSKSFEVNFTYDQAAINNFVQKFISNASLPSKDAKMNITTGGEITRTPEIDGISIDQEALTNSIYNLLSPQACLSRTQNPLSKADHPLTLDVSHFISPLKADVTLAALENVDTRITSFSTAFKPGTGSDINIAVAAKNINGTLLMPGETFSYNDIIGNTTLDKGYTYAPVIVNSQLSTGVGGGVCQVSTTLYNAILHTGLLPLERRPHSRPSTYVPLGLDAAIDWGTIDFKFTNTLQYPLYITAYTKGNKITIDIYSNKSLTATTYSFKSEVQKILPMTTKYINDSSLQKGQKKLVSTGTKGYIVKVFKETYVDGTLKSTNLLSTDTYAATPTIYKIGT